MKTLIPAQLVFAANVVVAGWISITCLFYPKSAQTTIFSGAFAYSEAIRLVGALWGGIFLLSIIGLFWPQPMQAVLLLQLAYKSTWLLVVALPAVWRNEPYPGGMAAFFILWVLMLPFAIDWAYLFARHYR